MRLYNAIYSEKCLFRKGLHLCFLLEGYICLRYYSQKYMNIMSTEVCACISISNTQQYSVWHTESYADFYKDTIHHSTLYLVLKIIHTTV